MLITGVVGASTNWLTLRVLCHHLYKVPRFRAPQVPPAQHAGTSAGHSEGGDTGVLLVSFLRKWDFWQEGLLRLVSRFTTKYSRKTGR